MSAYALAIVVAYTALVPAIAPALGTVSPLGILAATALAAAVALTLDAAVGIALACAVVSTALFAGRSGTAAPGRPYMAGYPISDDTPPLGPPRAPRKARPPHAPGTPPTDADHTPPPKPPHAEELDREAHPSAPGFQRYIDGELTVDERAFVTDESLRLAGADARVAEGAGTVINPLGGFSAQGVSGDGWNVTGIGR